MTCYPIATDANQANPAGTNFLQSGTTWDFERAVTCARAYQDLNVLWLEEPLPRYDFDHIAELNSLVELKIAGGEANQASTSSAGCSSGASTTSSSRKS